MATRGTVGWVAVALVPLLAHATPARADGPDLAAIARGEQPEQNQNRRFGLMLDGGLPDGATASLVIRPVSLVRINGGMSYNGISKGYRFGASLIPLKSWISPTLSFDYGHYSDGDANALVRMVTSDATFENTALDRVGYSYADAHVGVELGRKWFTFYVHAGASRVTGSVHELASAVGAMPQTSISFASDPTVTLTSVSARAGFIFYFAK